MWYEAVIRITSIVRRWHQQFFLCIFHLIPIVGFATSFPQVARGARYRNKHKFSCWFQQKNQWCVVVWSIIHGRHNMQRKTFSLLLFVHDAIWRNALVHDDNFSALFLHSPWTFFIFFFRDVRTSWRNIKKTFVERTFWQLFRNWWAQGLKHKHFMTCNDNKSLFKFAKRK